MPEAQPHSEPQPSFPRNPDVVCLDFDGSTPDQILAQADVVFAAINERREQLKAELEILQHHDTALGAYVKEAGRFSWDALKQHFGGSATALRLRFDQDYRVSNRQRANEYGRRTRDAYRQKQRYDTDIAV